MIWTPIFTFSTSFVNWITTRFKIIKLPKFDEGEIKALKDGLIELMEMVEKQATEEGSQGTTAVSTLTDSGDPATPPAKKENWLL